MKYEEIEIGFEATLSLVADNNTVCSYAHLIGDLNPVHLDDEYAAKSFFRKRVAHGMLGAGLISAILGMQLPGPGSIYLSQNLEFKAPVYIGDTIKAIVKVLEKHDKHKKIILRTFAVTQNEKLVLDGTATVLCREIKR
ncbi:MAG: MaoC family dehydratase [Candidatus Adiutrix sp.]